MLEIPSLEMDVNYKQGEEIKLQKREFGVPSLEAGWIIGGKKKEWEGYYGEE